MTQQPASDWDFAKEFATDTTPHPYVWTEGYGWLTAAEVPATVPGRKVEGDVRDWLFRRYRALLVQNPRDAAVRTWEQQLPACRIKAVAELAKCFCADKGNVVADRYEEIQRDRAPVPRTA